MTTKARILLGGVAMVAVAMLLSSQVVSQETLDLSTEVSEEEALAKMAKWLEVNAKGPEHEAFSALAGSWDTQTKMWPYPDAEPNVSAGFAEFRPILDGRYIEQTFHCETMDPPFEGLGIEGFDTIKKEYVSIWLDNTSTGIFQFRGEADETGTVITYHGQIPDPEAGLLEVRQICRKISDDELLFEMYCTPLGGEEFKKMEITYTRRP